MGMLDGKTALISGGARGTGAGMGLANSGMIGGIWAAARDLYAKGGRDA